MYVKTSLFPNVTVDTVSSKHISSFPSPSHFHCYRLSLGHLLSNICFSYSASPSHSGPRHLQALCHAQSRPLLRVVDPTLVLSSTSSIHCALRNCFGKPCISHDITIVRSILCMPIYWSMNIWTWLVILSVYVMHLN